ncbi:hypothetical protein [Flavobacterium muglaense]|uniref:Uncharacterized protein n=1 Tax=Flavobacterium muglaense TaxID=2764716 RepID=A0A923N0I9_9FLAO|nr:hypothetical protein [Flavobacterium muglaense]MBC5838479.1 hypothetical protein [Flavobacterium muglaense]MBC5844972.1 hypothetical protein [Flavobacterium muglaense]
MQLTTEQIECINQTLIEKGIKFDDIKLEVLDHIATEIEIEMEVSNNDFPIVYNQVFDNWREEFKLTRDFFSLQSTYPRLVNSKLKNQFKREVILSVVSSILLIISFQLVNNTQEKLEFIRLVKDVLIYAYCTTTAVALMIKVWNLKSKVTSTYKHLFDSRFTVLIIFISLIINPGIPHDLTNQNVYVGTISCFFVFLLSIIYLGMKHIQFQRKFSIQ